MLQTCSARSTPGLKKFSIEVSQKIPRNLHFGGSPNRKARRSRGITCKFPHALKGQLLRSSPGPGVRGAKPKKRRRKKCAPLLGRRHCRGRPEGSN